jgi:hypothetical protein
VTYCLLAPQFGRKRFTLGMSPPQYRQGTEDSYETQFQNSVLVEPSSFDGRSRHNLVSYLVGFILDCDVRRSEYSSEGCKGCQRIASAAACGAIKFRRPMQFGCMNG